MNLENYESSVRVAVVQATPVMFDREATVEKIRTLVRQAAEKGAKIVQFPEVFIPTYPRGLSFGSVVGLRTAAGLDDWLRLWKNCVSVPSKTTDTLGEIAQKNGVYLVVGVMERDSELSGSTIYNTTLYFSPEGKLVGKHRKLTPTASEKILWGSGDGSTLCVLDTPYGRIGDLICWENMMPLARAALYSKGVTIYMAPTADFRELWQSSVRHFAKEGRCFVLACNQYYTKEMYPKDLACYNDLVNAPEAICNGGSAIIDPQGQYIVGPVYDKEDILIADLEMDLIIKSRMEFDVVGHYGRPDVFTLVVNDQKRKGFVWCGADAAVVNTIDKMNEETKPQEAVVD